ncbi:protein GPR15L [Molossus molossus]|uniref:Colon-derived SUSD2 binding factor n=1 Tax=Molossus molossus TaxID=27622 RepID=A0A7J8B8L0_MOLMO|nr:protein GPR15L [Molossus molossus]KAF6394809.1 colon-derived SUSD2 binding factor [Molossus molossus]
MRLLVLCSLLCTVLLGLCLFSAEGKRHPKHPAKPWKGKPCCPPVPDPVRRTQKGDRVRTCRECKPKLPFWVVPGALPQV